MRNLKKLVAFIVTLAMIATFAIPAFAAAPTDVVGTAYEGAVTRLAALGVINGYPDGTFGPNDSITRAQAAAVVVRALGYESIAESAKGVTKFSDVTANYWGAGYINLAVSLGLIKGYGDGKFGPEDKVTYEQIVTMIVRALGQETYAENKGGFPTGYLLQAKVIGFTDGVLGVSGTNATRGIVAQLIDNAKADPIYVQTGFGDSTSYEKSSDTFLTKLGMSLQADDKIVTKTPASAGLDANTFVAGGVTYTAVAGTVDIESLLGKKVDLWGSAADSIVLAENVVGTSAAITSVDSEVYDNQVDVTLADGTTKTYTVVAGAGAVKNLKTEANVANVLDSLVGANTDMTQINFTVDGDNLQFVNAVLFTSVTTADTLENTVKKFVRLNGSLYIKYGDKDAAKVVIVKDGATVDWKALEAGDVLFVATAGVTDDNSKIDQKYVYVKATGKTVDGTLQSIKLGDEYATSVKVGGTWYSVNQEQGELDVAASDIGSEVTLTLDPAGKVFSYAVTTASVSNDKYGVVLATDSIESLGDTVYKVKLMNSTGDKVVYTIASDAGSYAKDDLVAYHVAADGTIDSISNDVEAGTSGTLDTSRMTFKNTEIGSGAVMFKVADGEYSVVDLAKITDDESATAVSYILNSDEQVVAAIFSTIADNSKSDATYAMVTGYSLIADGQYSVDLLTSDGAKSLDTADKSKAAAGKVVTYTVDADGKANDIAEVVANEDVDIVTGDISYADSSKIKVDGVPYWFTDSTLIIYDDGTQDGVDAELLTKTDLYKNMTVKAYVDTEGNILTLVVSAM